MALIPENRIEQILAGENISPENRTEAFVKEAIDNAGSGGGGGSDLPTPGTAGNVLTSTGDGWESAPPVGGDNDFVVEFEFAEDEVTGDITISTETAISAIIAALDAGKNVKGFSDDDNGYNEYYLKSAVDENLLFIQPGYNAVSITGYVDHGVDVWGWSLKIPNIPFAGESDEGKVLSVDDEGDYALVDPKYPLIVTGTISGSNITITTALADIAAAKAAGKPVYLDVDMEGSLVRLYLSGCDFDNDAWSVGFFCAAPATSAINIMAVAFDDGADTGALLIGTMVVS